jgi:hypothetical protein
LVPAGGAGDFQALLLGVVCVDEMVGMLIFSVILRVIHLSDYALPQVLRRQILCIGTQKASFLFFQQSNTG